MQKTILLSILFCAFSLNVIAQNMPQNDAYKYAFNFRRNSDLLFNEHENHPKQQSSLTKLNEPIPTQNTLNNEITEAPLTFYSPGSKHVRKPILAIKTNLLFDVVSLLNFEVEVPIGDRFSIAGEVIFPWWLFENKQHCLQMMSGNLEGRYWFNTRGKKFSSSNRAPMTGWFAGIYAGGGYYDIEWDKKGYQGEFFIAAGLSGGFAHSIGRNLRMEYSLGIGYMRTHYRAYEARINNQQQWQLFQTNTGNFTWIGPTRAKVSLVWMINCNIKQGDKRR